MMDISKADDIHIGNVPVQSAWLGGRKVWDRTERQIMRSMVCWYDISRQGCTNEAMAQNPVLKDLSGNGHDMTCYNFAWSGMSGIGGTVSAFSNRWKNSFEEYQIHNGGLKMVMNGTYAGVFAVFGSDFIECDELVDVGPIVVSNLPDETKLTWQYYILFSDGTSGHRTMVITECGQYTLNIKDINTEGKIITEIQPYRFYFSTVVSAANNFTIEQLPKYPGALVSDGVDDYCFVEGLPILTDYTVIARRKWLTKDEHWAFLFSKKTTENVQYICMENIQSKDGVRNNVACYSFGVSTDVDLYDGLVTYQTKGGYNGQPLLVGTAMNDAGTMSLFRSDSTRRDYGQLALWSFLLFDRTLTDAEIDWVKANLVALPGEDYLRLTDGILLKDGSPLLLKDGSPLALKRIENTD